MLYGCAVQGVPERYILFLEKINLFGSQYMCFSTAFGLARSGVHNVSSENYSIQLAGEMYSLYSKVPQHALQATAILFCSLKKKETVASFNQQFYNFTFLQQCGPVPFLDLVTNSKSCVQSTAVGWTLC